jgi:hypothetical protein
MFIFFPQVAVLLLHLSVITDSDKCCGIYKSQWTHSSRALMQPAETQWWCENIAKYFKVDTSILCGSQHVNIL